jgi:hypothetical protein
MSESQPDNTNPHEFDGNSWSETTALRSVDVCLEVVWESPTTGRLAPLEILRHIPMEILQHMPPNVLQQLPPEILRQLPPEVQRQIPPKSLPPET